MRVVMLVAVAMAATACVGDAAELGGLTNRVALPGATVPCAQARTEVAAPGKFVFPGDALVFFYAAGKDMPIHNMSLSFDINEQGETVNIAYTGPASDMRHATKQKLIRAAVDGVRTTRYAWMGAPSFAVGCTSDMDVMIRIHRDQI